ncbi:MAG: non-canonical purine NTP pyrophosphatase [Dehalococcoidia bacterium]|nr:non-canonical purine NTP pyrophosphatase [Dehalococcoidia bacterium]
MPRLLLASSNAGKAREIGLLLGNSGWRVVTPAEAGVGPVEVIELGRSYLENATQKAVAYCEASGMPALADDSGLEVDALDGAPGVLSARYGGPSVRTDAERTALLLRALEGLPAARRTARFRAVVALALPGDRVITREGTLEGRIALAPRGDSGFGYDPVFELADGRTVAESGELKQLVSHRAVAIRAMMDVLRSLREEWHDRSAAPHDLTDPGLPGAGGRTGHAG